MLGCDENGYYRVHTEPGKPGKEAIFTKSRGKPGVVREFSIMFILVREKSRKQI